jgi:hypothetical protein
MSLLRFPWLFPIRNPCELRGLYRRSYFGPRTCACGRRINHFSSKCSGFLIRVSPSHPYWGRCNAIVPLHLPDALEYKFLGCRGSGTHPGRIIGFFMCAFIIVCVLVLVLHSCAVTVSSTGAENGLWLTRKTSFKAMTTVCVSLFHVDTSILKFFIPGRPRDIHFRKCPNLLFG